MVLMTILSKTSSTFEKLCYNMGDVNRLHRNMISYGVGAVVFGIYYVASPGQGVAMKPLQYQLLTLSACVGVLVTLSYNYVIESTSYVGINVIRGPLSVILGIVFAVVFLQETITMRDGLSMLLFFLAIIVGVK